MAVATRRPWVAGRFYPADRSQCEALLADCLDEGPPNPTPARLGVVPHAGWVYSGPTAARTWQAVAASAVRTVILLGADHTGLASLPTLSGATQWETPLGRILVDVDLEQVLRDHLDLAVSAEVHGREHALEVQVPFIQRLCPETRIVPLTIPPDGAAAEFGRALARIVAERPDIAVVASSDLTHYGPAYGFAPRGVGVGALDWVKRENDRRLLDCLVEKRADDVVDEAHQRRSACGAGAVAALAAFAGAVGAGPGHLLHYTTSHDVRPDRACENFVGYAALTYPGWVTSPTASPAP